MKPLASICTVLAVAVTGAAVRAQDAQQLSKQLSNPVADLVSIPFQFNWENRVGPNDDLRTVINIQPVVPISLNQKWNLIGRFIVPYISQPILSPGGSPASGVGDIVASVFFSPKDPGRVTWGVGPVFGLPATTDPLLGSGKWSIGPTAVVLRQSGPWTFGGLVNHLWSIADTGNVDRSNVNQTFLQPFVSFATPGGVSYTINSESTANWEADSGQKWTVPINVSVGKITRLGPLPFNVQAGVGYYVAKPDIGPTWKLRLNFVVILPVKR